MSGNSDTRKAPEGAWLSLPRCVAASRLFWIGESRNRDGPCGAEARLGQHKSIAWPKGGRPARLAHCITLHCKACSSVYSRRSSNDCVEAWIIDVSQDAKCEPNGKYCSYYYCRSQPTSNSDAYHKALLTNCAAKLRGGDHYIRSQWCGKWINGGPTRYGRMEVTAPRRIDTEKCK
jgi:hypothetical protein